MKPAKVDLPTLWRGLDYPEIIFKWKDSDGNPFDLTGWTPYATSTNIDLAPQITDAPGGVTTISKTKLETVKVKLGTEQWDWVWKDPQGFEWPPALSGVLPIKEATTELPP